MILECLFLQLFNLSHGYCQEWNIFHYPSRVRTHLSFLPILIKYGTKVTQHFAIQILLFYDGLPSLLSLPLFPKLRHKQFLLDRYYILSCLSSSSQGQGGYFVGVCAAGGMCGGGVPHITAIPSFLLTLIGNNFSFLVFHNCFHSLYLFW